MERRIPTLDEYINESKVNEKEISDILSDIESLAKECDTFEEFDKRFNVDFKQFVRNFKGVKLHELYNRVQSETNESFVNESDLSDVYALADECDTFAEFEKRFKDEFKNLISKFGGKKLKELYDEIKTNEGKQVLITKQTWDKMSFDDRCEAVSGACEDPDDCEKYADMKFEQLPPQITSNLYECNKKKK
ncbi:MAG: hypothetical protein WC979_02855 [Candidatus Pacearchaeota archaeon]|jgi:hypothetical protein|nr:hypothetical protein [Clostridia bacterium]